MGEALTKKSAGPAPPRGPWLLRGDNFTPPHRTPWGGTRLRDVLKRDVPLAAERAAHAVVGESWELSVEPDFPSHLEAGDLSLDAAIQVDPAGALGAGGGPSTALLVKLIDTAAPLSVQIHPPDGHPTLGAGEGGKPESWYVVHRAPGAGVHLGLRRGVDRARMAEALARGEDVAALLHFHPAEVGDFCVIDAGTPHAIGAGLTLVEPQRVAPGRRGVTWRYWDWNRRYDAEGRADPSGRPRPLHVAQALDVTDWDAPREAALFAARGHRVGPPDLRGPATRLRLGGPEGARVHATSLRVDRLAGTGRLAFDPEGRLWGLTVVGGRVTVGGARFGAVDVPMGRSAALPAFLGPVELRLDAAHALLACIP